MLAQDAEHRDLVEQIAGDELDAILDVRDPLEVHRAAAPHHADHVVTLRQQQLRQVRPVLSRDARDERALCHDDVLRSRDSSVCEVSWHVREESENLGRRIADLRGKLGMTQQELAERLAVSRTAVSHLEAGMTVPGERTVVLLAGLFKIEPRELVAATNYPLGKAQRLPAVAARYTELELLTTLLDNDLAWLERAGDAHRRRVLDEWDARLSSVDDNSIDLRERELLRDARQRVRVNRDR